MSKNIRHNTGALQWKMMKMLDFSILAWHLWWSIPYHADSFVTLLYASWLMLPFNLHTIATLMHMVFNTVECFQNMHLRIASFIWFCRSMWRALWDSMLLCGWLLPFLQLLMLSQCIASLMLSLPPLQAIFPSQYMTNILQKLTSKLLLWKLALVRSVSVQHHLCRHTCQWLGCTLSMTFTLQ